MRGFFSGMAGEYGKLVGHLKGYFKSEPKKAVGINPNIAAKMVEVVYKLANGSAEVTAYQKLQHELKVKSGWEILCQSSDYEPAHQYGYRAIAFINHQTHQVQIATSGTRPAEKYDLWDDFKLVTGAMPIFKGIFSCVPNKLQPAKLFLDNITREIEKLKGAAAEEYTFGTCGHSLGAVMSDLTAAEMLSRGFKFSESTTFESPGSKAVVERAVADQALSGTLIPSIEGLAKKCVEYNAKRNFINSSGAHLAQAMHLVVFRQPAGNEQALVTAVGPTVLGYLGSYFYHCLMGTLRFSAAQLGLTALSDQLFDHRLSNFFALNKDNCYRVESRWEDKSKPLQCVALPGTQEEHQVDAEAQAVSGDFLCYQLADLTKPLTSRDPYDLLANGLASLASWEQEIYSKQPWSCTLTAQHGTSSELPGALMVC